MRLGPGTSSSQLDPIPKSQSPQVKFPTLCFSHHDHVDARQLSSWWRSRYIYTMRTCTVPGIQNYNAIRHPNLDIQSEKRCCAWVWDRNRRSPAPCCHPLHLRLRVATGTLGCAGRIGRHMDSCGKAQVCVERQRQGEHMCRRAL